MVQAEAEAGALRSRPRRRRRPARCRAPRQSTAARCTETGRPARTADPSQHSGVGSRRRPSDRAGAAVIAAARPSASTRACGAADGGRGIRGSFTS
eukprot:scaffold1683_cov125-Isochrysis_galbana.AAC.4